MDPQVVKNYHHSPTLALGLHGLHEIHEEVGVVVLNKDLEVHEASLSTDCANYGYRWPSSLYERKLHP